MGKPLTIPEREERERMAVRAAELTINHVGRLQAAKQLSEEFDFDITRYKYEQLTKHPTYRKILLEHSSDEIKFAIAELKLGAIHLVPKIIKALEEKLDKGDISGVPQLLKIIGIDGLEPTQQAQQLTVVLPGAEAPSTTIEVKHNDKSSKDVF